MLPIRCASPRPGGDVGVHRYIVGADANDGNDWAAFQSVLDGTGEFVTLTPPPPRIEGDHSTHERRHLSTRRIIELALREDH